jgi:hypothetical protein
MVATLLSQHGDPIEALLSGWLVDILRVETRPIFIQALTEACEVGENSL